MDVPTCRNGGGEGDTAAAGRASRPRRKERLVEVTVPHVPDPVVKICPVCYVNAFCVLVFADTEVATTAWHPFANGWPWFLGVSAETNNWNVSIYEPYDDSPTVCRRSSGAWLRCHGRLLRNRRRLHGLCARNQRQATKEGTPRCHARNPRHVCVLWLYDRIRLDTRYFCQHSCPQNLACRSGNSTVSILMAGPPHQLHDGRDTISEQGPRQP